MKVKLFLCALLEMISTTRHYASLCRCLR